MHRAPHQARCVMGEFARVGHQGGGAWRDHRLAEHAPAGIGHQGGAKAFDLGDMPGSAGLLQHCATAGNGQHRCGVFAAATAQARQMGEHAADWGRYYAEQPQVMAGSIALGQRLLQQAVGLQVQP